MDSTSFSQQILYLLGKTGNKLCVFTIAFLLLETLQRLITDTLEKNGQYF